MSKESNDPKGSDTVRDLPRTTPQVRDTVPEQAGVYVAPRALAPTSDHRTIQIKPVVLASHVDPRRAPTQLRLFAPPPPARHKRWLVPLGLLAVALGAVLAIRLTPRTPVKRSAAPAVAEARPAPQEDSTALEPTPVVPSTELGNPERGELEDLTIEPVPHAQDSQSPPAGVAFTSLPTAGTPPPVPSAAPRKKKRDPWLE